MPYLMVRKSKLFGSYIFQKDERNNSALAASRAELR